jgi:hypothetical protein
MRLDLSEMSLEVTISLKLVVWEVVHYLNNTRLPVKPIEFDVCRGLLPLEVEDRVYGCGLLPLVCPSRHDAFH